ncbi:hypothetical protein F53441_11746 [Fusarium austroafricanum]|uniref:tripeptidyl-peptidase II n=1 Tax=Fusarium austroafricanum TaxID=2364996 RepID=A0A8H4K293_9HYPO|nr:hypothetical protein F53441_11746 [Fusarium austroafricanum]
MYVSSLVLALSALPVAFSKSFSHHSQVPQGWQVEKTAKSAAAKQHVFSLALTMQNVDQLESKLLDVSSPDSANYGKWLSHDELVSTFAPSKDAVSSVTKWLKSNGVKHYKVNGGFIDFAVEIEKANDLLGGDYQLYTKDGQTKLRTLSYSIPDDVAGHIQYVDPSTNFGGTVAFNPVPRPSRTTEKRKTAPSKSTVDASCQTSITPSCLKQMYNIDYTPDAKSGSTIGFSSFLNQSAIYSDVFMYEDKFGIPKQNYTTVLISGGIDDQNPAHKSYSEADLDAENIVGIAHPLPFTQYITGGAPPFVPNIDQPTAADNQNEPYLPWLRYLLSQKDLPAVISTSYGDQEDSVPREYATLTCNLIGLLGLRGISMIFSSGDLGVGSGCLAPDGKTVEFNAIYPATCPYLTSVGGTVDVTPEIAWEGSSGGFSKYFPRPSYQDKAVKNYMKTVSKQTKKYYGPYTNWEGRGFPDVAGHSVSPDYEVFYAGKQARSGGTSAAAPVWGAIIGLLNDARFRAGKKSLGWLNPLIYKHGPKVLTDITGGHAIGCDGNNTQSGKPEPAGSGIVPGARWNATVGWDPVTGYGTPDFGKLKDLVLSF